MLLIRTEINTPEKLIKSIFHFVNKKYCSNMKQLSKTSCNFRKKRKLEKGTELTKLSGKNYFKSGQKTQTLEKDFPRYFLKSWF